MTIDPISLRTAHRALHSCPKISLEDSRDARAPAWSAKRDALLQLPQLVDLARSDHWLLSALGDLSPREQTCALSLFAICQGHLLETNPQKIADGEKKWRAFLDCLAQTESFYADIGGIVGYHARILDLLTRAQVPPEVSYDSPPTYDWSERGSEIEDAVVHALEMWEQTALIIPAGGAGDRLDLRDAATQRPLPAAFLEIDGVSMLEGIFRDLRGVEYLAQKKTGRRVETPVAIMTSSEKDNHAQIARYLEEHRWFGRSAKSIRLFCQHSVPVVTSTGRWLSADPLQLVTKPGGHGVLWRLARWCGIFDWLDASGCKKAIIRQINNPVASCDIGLLALAGLGWKLDKPFGFACCERQVGMAEGVNAVVERKLDRPGYTYAIENIEYSDLPAAFDVATPVERPFYANVNLLFVDLLAMNQLSVAHPLPGLMVNFKSGAFPAGKDQEPPIAGRLESTLQNIAQYLTHFEETQRSGWRADELAQFATKGSRLKSLSAAKRSLSSSAHFETPQSAYLDMQLGLRALLTSCGWTLPMEKEFVATSALYLHPALGPDYTIICQKLDGGSLGENSELRLEIANIDCRHLQLFGSLIVESRQRRRRTQKEQAETPEDLAGSCTLHNLRVENRGIASTAHADRWRSPPKRLEALHVILHGSSEFIAKDIAICGAHRIEVPDGHSLTAKIADGRLLFEMRRLAGLPTQWVYHWVANRCILERVGHAVGGESKKSDLFDAPTQKEREGVLLRSGSAGAS